MRSFHIGTILSITHGYLISPDHIGGVYAILNYMTGDNLYTHQLGRAGNECKPYLLEQFPWLKDITEAELQERIDTMQLHKNWEEMPIGEFVQPVLAKYVDAYGEMHAVRPIHPEDHEVIDPVEEAQRMMPQAKIVVVDTPPDEIPPEGDINWKMD